MRIPMIGIPSYNQENKFGFPIAALMHKYISAVIEAGAAPVILPSLVKQEALDVIFDRVDGLLFPGGGDLSPASYRGEFHASLDGVDEERDQFEIALVKAAIETRKPFLGICRGFQVVNVAMGGTLIAHLPDQNPNAIKHKFDSGTEREFLAHEVTFIAGTRLAEIFERSRIWVNSLHHQGIQTLAPGLIAAGIAPDGLTEALELPGHPFGMAVQWHPEWLPLQPGTQRLFQAFVEAAR